MSHLYDELGEWLGDHFEQLGRLLAGLQAEAGDQQLRSPGHEAAGRLQGQQHQHRQPVEAVVDGGAGKSPEAAGTKGLIFYSGHLLSDEVDRRAGKEFKSS